MKEERTLAVLVLASGIFVGLAAPGVADALRPWALTALFFVSVFSFIPFAQLPTTTLFAPDREVAHVVCWQQVILPCIAIAAGIVARFPDSVIVLMIVTVCSGSLFSSPALAEILGLDQKRTLQGMMLSTLVTPISLFAFLTIFHGAQANLDIAAFAVRTLIFLITPFLILITWRTVMLRVGSKDSRKIASAFRWATIIALLVFGTGLMSSVSDKLASDPSRVLFLMALATALCLLMMVLTIIVMHRLGKSFALTASVLAAFRNIGLGFALVGDAIGEDLAVYAGVSLLPMFIAPLIMRLVMLSAEEKTSSIADLLPGDLADAG
ncbi:MAG: hypothetical protein R3D67_18270 [Hyphomicrobiaceae bacterium]